MESCWEILLYICLYNALYMKCKFWAWDLGMGMYQHHISYHGEILKYGKHFAKHFLQKKDSEINSSTLVTRFANGPAVVGLDLIMRMCTTPVRLKHLRYSDDFAYFTENHTGS